MSRPVIKQEGLLNNTETIESGEEKFDLHVGELLLQIVLRRLQDPHVVQFLDRRSAKRPRAAEVPAIQMEHDCAPARPVQLDGLGHLFPKRRALCFAVRNECLCAAGELDDIGVFEAAISHVSPEE